MEAQKFPEEMTVSERASVGRATESTVIPVTTRELTTRRRKTHRHRARGAGTLHQAACLCSLPAEATVSSKPKKPSALGNSQEGGKWE